MNRAEKPTDAHALPMGCFGDRYFSADGRMSMEKGMSILDEKYTNFRKWLDSIVDKRGLQSTLTIGRIYKMLDFLDDMEKEIDDIIIAAFDESEQKMETSNE